jgi:hypothetical protein
VSVYVGCDSDSFVDGWRGRDERRIWLSAEGFFFMWLSTVVPRLVDLPRLAALGGSIGNADTTTCFV